MQDKKKKKPKKSPRKKRRFWKAVLEFLKALVIALIPVLVDYFLNKNN